MKKGAQKKMTIDDLAIVMAGSFSGLEERLTKKIDGVETRLGSVESGLEGVKNQLAGTNKRIDDFAETKVSKISHAELESRVGIVEKKLEVKK